MTERVEAIRRRFEDDPSSDNVFDATDIAILLAALAQAERDVQTWKDMGDKEHALAVQFAKEKEQAEQEREAAHEVMVETQQEFARHMVQWNEMKDERDAARAALGRYADETAWTHVETTFTYAPWAWAFDWPGELGDTPWQMARAALEGRA